MNIPPPGSASHTIVSRSSDSGRSGSNLWEQVARLYSLHVPAFRTTLRKKFAGGTRALTEDDVDDAIQDAFARLLCLLRAEAPVLDVPAAYVFAAARNSCVSMVRAGIRTAEQTVGLLYHLKTEQKLRDGTAEWMDESCGWFARYLEEAPPEIIDVYELRFVEGLAQHVCADRLGVSRRRVRTLEAAFINGLRAHWVSAHGESCLRQASTPGASPPAARNR